MRRPDGRPLVLGLKLRGACSGDIAKRRLADNRMETGRTDGN